MPDDYTEEDDIVTNEDYPTPAEELGPQAAASDDGDEVEEVDPSNDLDDDGVEDDESTTLDDGSVPDAVAEEKDINGDETHPYPQQ